LGLPIAIAIAKKIDVLGFDICETKVQNYKDGFDPTKEVGDEAVRNTTRKFSCDETSLKECKFHIVAVPTPVKADKTPDLTPIIKASETV
ncbi:nucleotide sugar dehydrogenase, partial [Francisella tularensis subsp. holarctica]|nr:nucleotide sugar dehydrogenase [Francisella tularensis subsp. holarctica]